MTYTAERIVKALDRELGFRRRLYPRKVAAGDMTEAEAQEEIGIVEQVRDEYLSRAEAERPQGKLSL